MIRKSRLLINKNDLSRCFAESEVICAAAVFYEEDRQMNIRRRTVRELAASAESAVWYQMRLRFTE